MKNTGSNRSRGRPRDWYDKTEQNTVKSLDRALEIFELLSSMEGATLTELAKAADQSPSTVYRVLRTLEGRDMIEFEPEAQTWNIGPQAFLIGTRFLHRTSLIGRARPILRRLMEVTGETANLAIERGGQVLFLSQVETQATIRAFFPPGTLSAMHSSGIGKALLAQYPSQRVAQIIRTHNLVKFTSRTLTNPEDLEKDLSETRRRGYSIDDEERNEGMKCVAAPVFDSHEEPIAGISVSGPSSRLPTERLARLGEEVRQSAEDLSRSMGADLSARIQRP